MQSLWGSAQHILAPAPVKEEAAQESPQGKKHSPVPCRFLAKRRDAPHIQPCVGAKKRISRERPSFAEMTTLVLNFEKHKYPNSSREDKFTHLRTWTVLHKKWFII